MRHKVPKIMEINLELIDFSFYFDKKLKKDNLSFSLSVNTSFKKPNLIVFFTHIRYAYEVNDEKHSLFHTDYLSLIEIEDMDWSKKRKLTYNKMELAHLLGMSTLMIRGAVSNRLSSNILANFPFPIISPIKLLEETLESKGDHFIITSVKKMVH